MANRKNKPDITVETLLRLKRQERPGTDFWDSFERDFQRRRLHALVEKPVFRDFFWGPGIKALAFGLPVMLVVALTVLWDPGAVSSSRTMTASLPAPVLDTRPATDETVAQFDQPETVPAVQTTLSSSQFVVDAIEESPSSTMNFRKVLYTPAIRLSAPSGAYYVRDSMSSSNYRVTTADMKLGRNF